ncbi:MAG: hypothetical protein R3E31_02065 [Chloroflexota bacterium]
MRCRSWRHWARATGWAKVITHVSGLSGTGSGQVRLITAVATGGSVVGGSVNVAVSTGGCVEQAVAAGVNVGSKLGEGWLWERPFPPASISLLIYLCQNNHFCERRRGGS